MAVNTKQGFFSRLGSAWGGLFPKESDEIKITRGKNQPQAFFPMTGGQTTGRLLFAGSFNGEKNLGEMGPIKYYLLDHFALSLRSWQAYVESAEAQAVLNKFCTWVVGEGLKLQAEPVKKVIGAKDLKDFSEITEARWQVYANSVRSHYSGRETVNQLANTCYKNAIIGGDMLVLLRYEERITIQLIDGAHVSSPMSGTDWFPMAAANGNRLINGIEINDRGEHVAYYVRKPFDSANPLNSFNYERIPARGKKSGILMAFMVYGSKFRVDTVRGMPLLTAVLEKLKKMERYEEATLGSAEEQAKIAYQVVHQMGGSGEFPFMAQVAAAHDVDANADLPAKDTGEQLANKVYATTNKQAVNNPVGAEIKVLNENKAQLHFKDFLEKNIDVVCACIEIPPNVAMSRYDSNYSASRAAVKDWEHTLKVKRAYFASQFYKPIYDFFLDVEVHEKNIQAPGYLLAQAREDFMVLDAYRTCRWVGAPVPNIDPVKEVEAERKKLGITGDSIPLTTVEQATEMLSAGDGDHNMEQYSEELEMSKTLGIKPEPEVQQSSVATD